jgi:hypothetical protein
VSSVAFVQGVVITTVIFRTRSADSEASFARVDDRQARTEQRLEALEAFMSRPRGYYPPSPPPPPPTIAPSSPERSRRSIQEGDCPRGYLAVHDRFCVAQFEMKDRAGAAVSEAAGDPLRVNRNAAVARCEALGAGYRLIANDEWQEIAHDVESVGANWSGGAPGKGVMNVGNFAVEVGPADLRDPCATPGFAPRFAHCADPDSADFVRRRTHWLRSGASIWDLGGNLMEWTSTPTGPAAPDSGRQHACDAKSPAREFYGPRGRYECDASEDPLELGCFEGSGGSVALRGGASGMEGSPWNGCRGIYYVNTNAFWTPDRTGPGFRCVYQP